jgi:hypothetical protein
MSLRINGEADVFRLIAGTMMVLAIVFGVLELMDVIHV